MTYDSAFVYTKTFRTPNVRNVIQEKVAAILTFFQSLKYKAVFAHEKSGQDIFPVVVHDTYHTAASDKFIPLKIVNVVLASELPGQRAREATHK